MPGRAQDPLVVPDALWEHPETIRALRERDMGRLFHLLRQYAGASQTQIAIACGMTQGRVSETMKAGGRRIHTLEVFERIADGLGMPDSARLALGLAPRAHAPATEPPAPQDAPSAAEPASGLVDSLGVFAAAPGDRTAPDAARPFVPGADPEAGERLAHAARRPARLDAHAIAALSTMLAGQRRLEDRIGPAALVAPATAQLPLLAQMLREAPSAHRAALAEVVSEWATFAGWLHLATGRDETAKLLFRRAEELADEGSDGTLAATAVSFRGYLERLRGRPRAVVRWTAAALETPGSHPAQRAYDCIQLAQGHAALGDLEQMRRHLDRAAELAARTAEPPPSVYWYNEPFFHVQIGLAHLEARQYRQAADMIATGLAGMSPEQRAAQWVAEYDEALTVARDRA
ncbi:MULTISPECIES: helix-turn-helix domain-containing protein [Thermomonospora]|uniref:Helix-turn-helix domain protein n=1 Tax=Thermomonospora curvata (strain ATCC 19995 / DSM 43183 / JCM 3096 / KCTC 9072 / NBRC 15933 / NCIMB 10081 / Henssen B9) TaxID=471852 RepID=D1ABK2_THECD|nr:MULTISPECIES: helix-turn-helix domain-containing protein [Thermomonospora]ACY97238.1 hypothetical protein Tcur_1662 [Thermomonospora curvata DSM 43183]